MTGRLRDGLIAGLLAAVIWMVITTLGGFSAASVVGWGLALLVIGFVVTFAVATAIARSRGPNAPSRR